MQQAAGGRHPSRRNDDVAPAFGGSSTASVATTLWRASGCRLSFEPGRVDDSSNHTDINKLRRLRARHSGPVQARSASRCTGSRRMRLPVACQMAFAIAAATPVAPSSPIPRAPIAEAEIGLRNLRHAAQCVVLRVAANERSVEALHFSCGTRDSAGWYGLWSSAAVVAVVESSPRRLTATYQ